jgi:hypothetical protein
VVEEERLSSEVESDDAAIGSSAITCRAEFLVCAWYFGHGLRHVWDFMSSCPLSGMYMLSIEIARLCIYYKGALINLRVFDPAFTVSQDYFQPSKGSLFSFRIATTLVLSRDHLLLVCKLNSWC